MSFVDLNGIRHTAEVEADSLYEAAVYGVDKLRRNVWVSAIGPATKLEIVVLQPTTKHELTLAQVEHWLGTGLNSPADKARKARLKAILIQGHHGD